MTPNVLTTFSVCGAAMFLSLVACTKKMPTEQAVAVPGFTGTVAVATINARELTEVAGAFSLHIPESLTALDREIARLNQLGSTARIPLSAPTFRILDMGLYYSRITRGAYDFTMGPVQDLWTAGEPDPGELIRAIARTGMQFVEAQDNGRITFSRPDISIQLGPMARAFAVDAAVALLKSSTTGPFSISNGYLTRRHRDFPAAEVPHPALPVTAGFVIGNFQLSEHETLVIRTIEQRPVLIDPRDGRPARGGIMAAVAGRLATKAHALAEALLVLGPEEAAEILPSFEEYEVLLVTSASPFRAKATGNFMARAKIAPDLKKGIEPWIRSGGLEGGERRPPFVEGLPDDRTGEVRTSELLER